MFLVSVLQESEYLKISKECNRIIGTNVSYLSSILHIEGEYSARPRIHKIVYETIAGFAKGILCEARAHSHAWPARTVGPINISRESVKGRKCERHGGEGSREPATQRQAGACNRFAPSERARCCALFNSTRYCTVTHHHLTHMTLRGTNLSSSRAERFLPGSRELPSTRRPEIFATNNARRIASREGHGSRVRSR